MYILAFLAISNSFLYADHIDNETSYILDFKILGINFYIEQNKNRLRFSKGKTSNLRADKQKFISNSHHNIFIWSQQ